ncbi:MAG: VWA domain-containing protein [Sphingobacteriales bacterium]|nr:MAG: VWA domain-containing protein [Sphingobacteriales bacterium]
MKNLLFLSFWITLTCITWSSCSNRDTQKTTNSYQTQQSQNVVTPQQNAVTPQQNVYTPQQNFEPENTVTAPAPADNNSVARASTKDGNIVQVSILLDTSNSMDGLIDQAKSQLWKMVGELALARDSKGNIPNIELGLYDYGNDRYSSSVGYIQQISPLTTDLDMISEKLFALTTYGGSEYCGHVIQTAVRQLDWNKSNDILKIIFIAGNEEFTQGSVSYKDACKEAAEKGIIINTIFCGSMQEGIETKWKDGADCADGKYMNIDQNRTVVHIDAPQDKEINQLNEQLNDTYIGYGKEGKHRKELQMEQDMNASQYGSSNAAQRSATKASANYKNTSWDLVDAVEDKSVKMDELSKDDLPEEMKNMNVEQRKAYVESKAKKRKEIQERIQQLNAERRTYVANEERKMAEQEGTTTLDAAIIGTIRTQAKEKGYKFEDEK